MSLWVKVDKLTANALNELKERGFHVVGLDSSGHDNLCAIALRAPLALGAIKSLNVSNAAALALYVAASKLGMAR